MQSAGFRRLEIAFYPDGIVHTCILGLYKSPDSPPQVLLDFSVIRRNEKLSIVYHRSTRPDRIARCLLDGRNASLWLVRSDGKKSVLDIRESETFPGVNYAKLEVRVESRILNMFEFLPAMNRIVMPRHQSEIIFTANASALPSITDTSDRFRFVYAGQDDRKTIVRQTTKEDMPLWTFSITGRMFRSRPLFAVLNYYLVNDGIAGIPIYPFIGGSPAQ